MYYKNIICIFKLHVSRGIKAAQMPASTDFHTITHAMNASVNLASYYDKFGLQDYYYSKT